MSLTTPIRKIKRLLWIGCVFGAAPLGMAVNYTNTDLLLVFRRDTFNDVLFDVGPVSNYVGLTAGAQKTVDFDAALVKSNFNDSFEGVKFLVVAATGLDANQPRVWISDVFTSPSPTDLTLSKFSQIRSKISAAGQQASILTSSNALPMVMATSQPGSFTYIASDANLTPASSLGGLTGFPIEGAIPGSLTFYQLQVSATIPKPPGTLLGTFQFADSGILTFTAGGGTTVTAPKLTGITRAGDATTVSFETVTGLKYQLRYGTALPGTFTAVGETITGDGSVKTLSDSSSDLTRFYQVQATQ